VKKEGRKGKERFLRAGAWAGGKDKERRDSENEWKGVVINNTYKKMKMNKSMRLVIC
jgi:hypothetical protein